MWLRRHFLAFAIFFAALVTIAEGSLPRAETHRLEEPCGIALIGACLPRRVVAWEQAQGAVVEATQGFTLVEIAIVLMVIGLIVGGVLVGQDLINAAAEKATITQVDRFNVAASTFVTKYGYLPGDIPASMVTTLGFPVVPVRAGTAGQGDGNGLLEGYGFPGAGLVDGLYSGEPAWFWEDLSANTHLIEGNMNVATNAAYPWGYLPSSQLPFLFPAAKLGNGQYFAVYTYKGFNYYSMAQVGNLDPNGAVYSAPGARVEQAYNIDKKIDDGLPQSGIVTAQYENWSLSSTQPNGVSWASGGGIAGASPGASITGSFNTCYDNGGGTGAMQYSMEISNGANVNCALSFKMQGAAR